MTVATRLAARTVTARRVAPGADIDVDGWHRQAARSLASGHWREADHAARRALDLQPADARAWVHLAAAFAGPGWFDQAERCLAEARRLGGDAPADEAPVGRAVNAWALGPGRGGSLVLVALVLVLGLLGVAVALTLPFAAREVRLRRLPPPWRSRAERAWLDQRGLRLRWALAVAATVSVWALATSGA